MKVIWVLIALYDGMFWPSSNGKDQPYFEDFWRCDRIATMIQGEEQARHPDMKITVICIPSTEVS